MDNRELIILTGELNWQVSPRWLFVKKAVKPETPYSKELPDMNIYYSVKADLTLSRDSWYISAAHAWNLICQ
jgi:hypothetical protein